METTKYKYRSLARVIMEAATPLSIGSGDKNIITDALILTDVNGLPYIPGTTLAGIIRHALKKETGDRLFGYQKTNSNARTQTPPLGGRGASLRIQQLREQSLNAVNRISAERALLMTEFYKNHSL